MKSFSYHLPFGTKGAYAKEIKAADLGKIANLIRICGFPMQTKVYVLWKSLPVTSTERGPFIRRL